jgi:hypothetical protein
MVSDTVCPVNLTLSFLLAGGNTVSVPWNCGAPALSVSIASLSNTSCQTNRDGSWTCNEAVSEAGNAQGDLTWSASSDLKGVIFKPSTGSLAPGGSTTFSINIPANDCMNGTFTFSGGAQPVNVSWSCSTQLMLSVSPTSFNVDNCSNNGQSWTCVATLSSNGTLGWYAVSSDQSNIRFSVDNGTLYAGQPQQAMVYIVASCPSSATITFVGKGANTVDVPWSC